MVYLSMPQVVERYAGVWSRWQLYEHVRLGMLPHVKLPGRRELLFRLDDLDQYGAARSSSRRSSCRTAAASAAPGSGDSAAVTGKQDQKPFLRRLPMTLGDQVNAES